MTFDHIARHAAARPGAIAIVNNGFAISYEGLARAVAQFTQALGGLGLRPGQAAGPIRRSLSQPADPARLRATRRGHHLDPGQRAGKADAMLDRYDLVVNEHPGRAKGARRVMAITRPWVKSALALPPAAGDPVVALPDPVVRIVRTSGPRVRPSGRPCAGARSKAGSGCGRASMVPRPEPQPGGNRFHLLDGLFAGDRGASRRRDPGLRESHRNA